jgi:hypothetical protein
MANDTGVVNIHGKQYSTVAKRVKDFREIHHFELSLTTDIVSRDDECVVMKATITNADGRVLATGHSEEYRHTSQINRTSALENAETSAIGRALAALGLGGTEFASADEVANAIGQQKSGVIKPSDGAMDRVSADRRKVVTDTLTLVLDALKADKDHDAYGLCESLTDPDEKVALWSRLDSKQRRRIKNVADASKEKEAA